MLLPILYFNFRAFWVWFVIIQRNLIFQFRCFYFRSTTIKISIIFIFNAHGCLLVLHEILGVGIVRAAATTALPLAMSVTFATLPSLKEWMVVAAAAATATGAVVVVVVATATGGVDIKTEAAGVEGKEIGEMISFKAIFCTDT